MRHALVQDVSSSKLGRFFVARAQPAQQKIIPSTPLPGSL
jgi:hypothetical protein